MKWARDSRRRPNAAKNNGIRSPISVCPISSYGKGKAVYGDIIVASVSKIIGAIFKSVTLNALRNHKLVLDVDIIPEAQAHISIRHRGIRGTGDVIVSGRTVTIA